MKNSIWKYISSKRYIIFFKIPFLENLNLLKFLITNNHVIDKSIIDEENKTIGLNSNNDKVSKEIALKDRITYTNKEYDITIIEDDDGIKNNLEIDKTILLNSIKSYVNKQYIYYIILEAKEFMLHMEY